MSLPSQLRGWVIAGFLGPTGQRIARLLRHLRAGGLPGRGPVEVYHDPSDPISLLLLHKLHTSGVPLPASTVLFVVAPPAADVDPAPEARRHTRLADARRLAVSHGLSFPASPVRPSSADAERVRQVLAVSRPFPEHVALASRLTTLLWSGDAAALSTALDGLPTQEHDATARLRARGFYAGASVYYRGAWFPDLDRFPYLEAELLGRPVAPLALPEVAENPTAPTIEFFFSFRSPYSYLAVERLFALAERTGARVVARPVLPMVMRNLAVPRIKRLYLVQDAAREARRHGVPFGRIADPLGVGVERCLAIHHHLPHPAQKNRFLRLAARGIWSEALDVATDPDLREVCARAGVSWSVAQDALVDASWRDAVEANRAALLATGFWGVPCFQVAGTAFWGQDRLPDLAHTLLETA